ncbi:Ubiquitin fusion degradation protein [Drechslerella dactyloides]|uniref:Ubiquitin fusion degradation protein n=1 Tax=Drechslerella dactyloides TaxID=74499 RepID=A0AAD6IRI7_DREDA|nr:Ubiquitin fusion degradation protein [Drechslerella dactyloides]
MARSAAVPAPVLDWISTFRLSASPPPSSLTGDKLLLPQAALEKLLEAASKAPASLPQSEDYEPADWETASPYEALNSRNEPRQQLPHPLIFRVTNLANGRTAYAGIREFSAEEDEVVLSNFLREGLAIPGFEQEQNGEYAINIEIEAANIPKGTFARLRPLDAGYEEDWKPILENHLQKNFTTLAVNNILTVPPLARQRASGQKDFKFLIDQVKPEGSEAICIVDTDLEVDIEPLNEEQAKESLRRRELRKIAESSSGGLINTNGPKEGMISGSAYVHFQLQYWNRSKPILIQVPEENVDIMVTTDAIQGSPNMEEWIWGRFNGTKPIAIMPDDPRIQAAKEIKISLHVYEQSPIDEDSKGLMPAADHFLLSVTQSLEADGEDGDTDMSDDNPDNEICSNCKRSIPKQSMFLHQNFCFRNNILCPHGCGQVFKKGTEADHWHCAECKAFGTNQPGRDTYSKHMDIAHTPRRCDSCDHSAGSLGELATHKTTTCPHKLILCRFCHLILPQEEDLDFTAAITGLAPHEKNCGGRTTNCHICKRIVQLKNMEAHLKNHDFDRKSTPLPRICRNVNCSRTVSTANSSEEQLGLCSVCYGPLYSVNYDPTGATLSRRAELRYLTQLLRGCGKPGCTNEMCKTGRANRKPPLPAITSKEATPVVKSLVTVDGLQGGYTSHPLHFCVDEATQKRKNIAEMLSYADDSDGKGGWAIEWCTKAVEVADAEVSDETELVNKARDWLEKFAVRRDE